MRYKKKKNEENEQVSYTYVTGSSIPNEQDGSPEGKNWGEKTKMIFGEVPPIFQIS